jgi:DNA-binding CsgD family transcriptional regulator
MEQARMRAVSKALANIAIPLKEYIDADLFTYVRYENNICKIITNDTAEMTAYLNDEESFLPGQICCSSKIIRWNQFCSTDHLSMISDELNYSVDGITFFMKHNDSFMEHISLNTHNINTNLLENALLVNGGINSIIAHIRNNINFNAGIFNSIMITREFSIPPSDDESNSMDMSIGLHNRLYLRGLNGETYLTRMEKKCLEQLLKLKTSHEIAIELNSKKRTVECHIANLKKKLGIRRKPELFQVAKNNFLLPPAFDFTQEN